MRTVVGIVSLLCTTCQYVPQEDRVNTRRLLENPEGYAGRLIVLELDPLRYTPAGPNVEIYTGLPGGKPVVVLEGVAVNDNARRLYVSGRVKDVLRDGVDRGQGFKLCVTLHRCREWVRPGGGR